MTRKLVAATISCAILASGSAHAVPVLLGSATLNNPDDLTKIRLDSGEVVEWLDINETSGMNIPDALSAFGGDGFHVATLSEMQPLFATFNLPTTTAMFPLSTPLFLPANVADLNIFRSFLGFTQPDGDAIGWLNDEVINAQTGLINVRNNTSIHDIFVNDLFGGDDGTRRPDGHGVWLVRAMPTGIPAPGSLALLGIGLALCGRHRHARR